MKIDFEDKTYSLDLEDIDVRQATLIKVKTGYNLLEWQAKLEEGDVDALRALYWLMRTQSGESVNIDAVNFKIVKFANALQEAQKDPGESGENPTVETPAA